MSKSSVVWDYFTLIGGGQVKCGLCCVTLKMNRRASTSNMMRHLRTKHTTVDLTRRRVSLLDEVDDPGTTEQTSDSGVMSQTAILTHQEPGTSTSNNSTRHSFSRPVKPNLITNYFSKPVGFNRINLIDQQLLKMVVKEYYPFSIVEDREFVKLLNMLNPGYTLPSRKTLTKSYLSVMYNEVYDRVKNDINVNAHFVSLTTDSWTSIKNENYTAVTTHFINGDGELKSYLLSCFKYTESHTSENLKTELLRVVTEWGIENKIAACTTDNASNIVGGIIKCNWRHIECFAHSLNLIVLHALKEVQEIRDKIKGIVEHFRRSPQAAAKLKLRQKQLEFSPTLNLLQDVDTRWNSTHDMFERVLHLKNPLLSALVDSNYYVYLSASDWQLISDVCSILKRFKEITIEISSEKTVTISKVVVFSKVLLKYCVQLKQKFATTNTSTTTTKFINILTDQVETRFGNLEKIVLYAEAVILDPRFKKHGFLNENAFVEGKKSLVNNARTINLDSENHLSQASIPSTSSDSVWNDFDTEIISLVECPNPTSAFIVEIDKYLLEPLIPRTADPLLWWQENRNVYPRLFQIMKKRLCIMATSVPCERIFSKARKTKSQTIVEKRNRLDNSNFEKIIFLNFNL